MQSKSKISFSNAGLMKGVEPDSSFAHASPRSTSGGGDDDLWLLPSANTYVKPSGLWPPYDDSVQVDPEALALSLGASSLSDGVLVAQGRGVNGVRQLVDANSVLSSIESDGGCITRTGVLLASSRNKLRKTHVGFKDPLIASTGYKPYHGGISIHAKCNRKIKELDHEMSEMRNQITDLQSVMGQPLAQVSEELRQTKAKRDEFWMKYQEYKSKFYAGRAEFHRKEMQYQGLLAKFRAEACKIKRDHVRTKANLDKKTEELAYLEEERRLDNVNEFRRSYLTGDIASFVSYGGLV